jgi:hypothetical protein
LKKSSYPATRYQPPNIPDYFSFAERRRLSGPTLRRFLKIVLKWELDTRDVRLLFGGITTRHLKRLSTRMDGRILSQDQLLRATSSIAIDRCLYKLLPRRQADKWARTPNRQLPGGTPLFNMIAGGLIPLWELRLSLETQVSEMGEE